MNEIRNNSHCLASLAVFREIYDSEKDTYGIIASFLNETIISHGKHQFSLSEIHKLINTSYDFNLPEAIIKTSLKRLRYLNKASGIYTVDNFQDLKKTNINQRREHIQKSNDKIINEIYIYIEKQLNKKLDGNEKVKIINSFCSFLLDESISDHYSEFISSYVIINKEQPHFIESLNLIKEGVVLYTGIKYNPSLDNISSWTSDLTIYLDTEIIFHAAGYNGELYKSLFDDLYSLIKEINKKNNKIHLKYFTDVQEEIDNFFKKAEYIIKGQDKPNPSITAMGSILEGCQSPSDIIEKKTEFCRLLKKLNITEEEYTGFYSDSTNYEFNIISEDVISQILIDNNKDDVNKNLNFLNYISLLRKEHQNNNFYNIKCILLTGNSISLSIAWHDEVKNKGDVPYATDIYFLTTKFWSILNKGFGSPDYPKTFDIISKAQILLSSQINNSVNHKYDSLKLKFNSGKLSEEQAIEVIVNLRNQAKKPEEIHEEDIEFILDSITDDKIEKYIEEQEHFKSKAIIQAEENTKLKYEIEEKSLKHNLLLNDKAELLLNLIEEKKRIKRIIEDNKSILDNKAQRKYFWFKSTLALIYLTYYSVIIFLIFKLTWNVMEQWTWILGVIPILLSFLYLLFKERILNPIKFLEQTKTNMINNYYNKSNYDILSLDNINSEIISLENELSKINN